MNCKQVLVRFQCSNISHEKECVQLKVVAALCGVPTHVMDLVAWRLCFNQPGRFNAQRPVRWFTPGGSSSCTID